MLATVPNDVFARDARARRSSPDGLPRAARAAIEYHTALCLLLELDRGFSPFYWTNIADPALPFVGADRAHEPDRAASATAAAASSTSPTTSPPGHELLALDADALLDRYEPGLRAHQPGLRPLLGAASAGCTASPPRSRS